MCPQQFAFPGIMPLPELIEIVPTSRPVQARITVPGSKSITNRALILAALADGEVRLKGALWSEDTQIMVECLQELGFIIHIEPELDEACNRTITVFGKGGAVPPGGSPERPMELFVGNAGTAARFLAAFLCLGRGVYRLHGVNRMHERPQASLFAALRELGFRVEAEQGNERLPASIFGGAGEGRVLAGQAGAVWAAKGASVRRACQVSIEESSQFASALLLCAQRGNWEINVTGENAEESPYVAMTSKLIEVFPSRGGQFKIEPDASSGSYFWAAGWLQAVGKGASRFGHSGSSQGPTESRMHGIEVLDWPSSGWQPDAAFTDFSGPKCPLLPVEISRLRDLGDSIMTAIVIAPFNAQSVQFTDLGRLRVQECERVLALRTELARCGANVVEQGDTLLVSPSQLHGAEIETYSDHRMAMCFAILGLHVPGIAIKNPACVKKTFPNFFQKLAAPAPGGLGTVIRDALTGRELSQSELFAD